MTKPSCNLCLNSFSELAANFETKSVSRMLKTWLVFYLLTTCAFCEAKQEQLNTSASSHNSFTNNATTLRPEGFNPLVSGPAQTSAFTSKQGRSLFTFTPIPNITVSFSTDGSVPPNWVGPTIESYADSACYRKTHKANSRGECSLGYDANYFKCWAQCPISYPVQCFSECIPQNIDCSMEVMTKVTNPGYVVFNFATAGVFNVIDTLFKAAKIGVICAFNVFNVAEGISRFVRVRQTITPNGTHEEILAAVYQTDMFLVDLPVALTACMGYRVSAYAILADVVVTAAENIVKQLVRNHEMIMGSVDAFMAFLQNTTAGNLTMKLDADSIANLTSLINSGSSCGFGLKRLTDRVIVRIADIRDENPLATNEDIRTKMSRSSIVLQDVPAVTNKCFGELLKTEKPFVAYQIRDTLRKTIGVIVDQLIDRSTTDMGKAMARKDYLIATSNMGLLVLSALDPTGLAYMTYNYVQPVCGPTEFIGEIDDGNLTDALGLITKDNAFQGSEGIWTKKGDGVVKINFVSTDTKSVKVAIHSGGGEIDSVYVDKGENVTWTSTVKALQGRTLYLTRKRRGFLGFTYSSGGSLLLWVPMSSEGGHLNECENQRKLN